MAPLSELGFRASCHSRPPLSARPSAPPAWPGASSLFHQASRTMPFCHADRGRTTASFLASRSAEVPPGPLGDVLAEFGGAVVPAAELLGGGDDRLPSFADEHAVPATSTVNTAVAAARRAVELVIAQYTIPFPWRAMKMFQ